MAGRNVDHRSESGASEQHSILVPNELLLRRISLLSPMRAVLSAVVEVTWQPTLFAGDRNKVAAPANARPVQLQALALKLGCGDFKLVAAADVSKRTQKPIRILE